MQSTQIVPDREFPRKLCGFKDGPIPLSLYLCFAAIILLPACYGKLPKDMTGDFAITFVLGILLGDIGLRISVLQDIGGPAKDAIFPFTSGENGGANFLYFYIACLATGSILGMLREVLIQGFLRMFG